MFLKEFAITRYGPLEGKAIKELGYFTLFLSPNEEGKTLTIDALLKMMFGKRALKPFAGIKRVKEPPEGYLILERQNKDFNLPRSGFLSDLFDINALDFRNIFLIRDSDLGLTDEAKYYQSLTGRLTGMRTDQISFIKENLKMLGGITGGGDFINTAPEKLKDKYDDAQELLEEIEALLDELEKEKFSSFEVRLARLQEQQQETKTLLESYNQAYSREIYEKAYKALESLQNAKVRLSALDKVNRIDYETWQRAESNLNYLISEVEQLKKEKADQKKQLQEISTRIGQEKEKYRKLEYLSSLVKEKIAPQLEQDSKLTAKIKKEEVILAAPLAKGAAVLSTLVFVIALTGSMAAAEWWLILILFGSLTITLAYGFFRFQLIRKKALLEQSKAEIYAAAEKLELPANDLKAVRASIGRLDRDLELGLEILNELENEKRWLEKEVGRLNQELQNRNDKIKQEESRITAISLDKGIKTLSEFFLMLEEKQVLKGEIEKQQGILFSHFGPEASSAEVEITLPYWQEKLEQLKSYASAKSELRYDQAKVNYLKRELSRLEKEIEQGHKVMTWCGDQLRDLEKRYNGLMQDDDYLLCQTTADLETARQKIVQWQNKLESRRSNALLALDIFERIGLEEEQKVSALFGAGQPVSDYFESITAGRYKQVLFDSDEKRIKILCDNGQTLDAGCLSGGAYDQLYFSIRLALGEHLLKGEKGFFILDDPFIKADKERLETMLALLGSISRKGWQIIYFSAKEEVRAALKDDLEKGRVQACTLSI